MNAGNVLKLSRWVERNRSTIVGGTLTQSQIADKAKTELGFKVPTTALRDVLQSHGIETRRKSETAAKIDSLTIERDKYRNWLLRSIDAGAIKAWLLKEMQKEFVDDKQLAAALTAKLNTEPVPA